MNSNSGGSVPKKTGKKYARYSPPGHNAQMKNALDAALKRLGDPVVGYRSRRNQIVKRKMPPQP